MMRTLRASALPALVHVLAILPLVWLAWQFSQDRLGANPIRELQVRTGKYTINLLVLTLSCTPVYRIFRFGSALKLRRTLGLYTFAYAGIHFLNFIGLDYGFNLSLIREDIVEKRFALAGFAAFLVFLVLAVTSMRGWRRRLGRVWSRLHRLIYVAAGLAVLHFAWQSKTRADIAEPLLYAGIVLLLLVLRVPAVVRAIDRLRGDPSQNESDKAAVDGD